MLRATQNNNLALARYFVSKGASVVVPNPDKASLIHSMLACSLDDDPAKRTKPCAALLKFLIEECNINVDIRDREGATPLHWAAHYANLDFARMLVTRYGANHTLKDAAGRTPLEKARYIKNLKLKETATYDFDSVIAYLEKL